MCNTCHNHSHCNSCARPQNRCVCVAKPRCQAAPVQNCECAATCVMPRNISAPDSCTCFHKGFEQGYQAAMDAMKNCVENQPVMQENCCPAIPY